MFFFILGSPDKAEPVASRTKVDLVLPEVCTGKMVIFQDKIRGFPGQNWGMYEETWDLPGKNGNLPTKNHLRVSVEYINSLQR